MKLTTSFCMLVMVGSVYAGPTADFFAKGTWTGMLLSIADAETQGKISHKAALCLKSLEYSQLLPVYASLLQGSLSPQELTQSDAFYSSEAGEKYAQQGFAQIYTITGHTVSEAMPNFTERELDEVEAFSQSSAGAKLNKEHAMESQEARKAISERIQAMVKSCR